MPQNKSDIFQEPPQFKSNGGIIEFQSWKGPKGQLVQSLTMQEPVVSKGAKTGEVVIPHYTWFL